MNVQQQAVSFGCDNEWLVGVISRPEQPRPRGVLIAVGGAQYRVGSHRQFALLARHLAMQGTAVMRFDYRGMGDSSGETRHFEHTAPDLRAALDMFLSGVPEIRDVVIWGLCDAASAALLYAHNDARVSGLVLLNPWVRTAESEARTYLRHYYVHRLFEAAPWRKLLQGEFDIRSSATSLLASLRRAIGWDSTVSHAHTRGAESLPDRMAGGLERFGGRVLFILSGNDLTAKEFCDTSDASPRWRRLMGSSRVTRYLLPQATHTFSRREWRDRVATWTSTWVQSW